MKVRILVCAFASLVLSANATLAVEAAPPSALQENPSPAAPLDPATMRAIAVAEYFGLVSMKAALTKTCAAHVDVDALARLQAHIVALPEFTDLSPALLVLLQSHIDRGTAEGVGNLFPNGVNTTDCARMMGWTDDGLIQAEPAMRAAVAQEFAQARVAR